MKPTTPDFVPRSAARWRWRSAVTSAIIGLGLAAVLCRTLQPELCAHAPSRVATTCAAFALGGFVLSWVATLARRRSDENSRPVPRRLPPP